MTIEALSPLAPPEGIVARKSAAKHRRFKGAKPTWVVVGVDISLTSMSGAMMMYDGLLDRMRGPSVHAVRWERDVDFFSRMDQAARSANFILDLMSGIGGVIAHPDQMFIGVEEPWPAGIVKRAESGWLRQQAQIQGAFISGLVRFGYRNVYEVNAQSWRALVAHELGMKVNREFDKWTVKEWAIDAYSLPDLPDLIDNRKRGLIPKPPTSKAKPRQPDDIYDACGIMAWMEREYLEAHEV